MLPATKPLRIQLPGREGAADPAFLIRPASLEDRLLFEADLASPPYNAGPVPNWQLIEALRGAVGEWCKEAPEDGAAFLAALAQAEAAPEDLMAEDRQRIDALEALAKAGWPPYQALISRRQRRLQMLPYLACRRFLAGWENIDHPFARDMDGQASKETVEALGEVHRWLGLAIFERLSPTADEGKASAPPPASGRGRGTSQGGSARQTAGRAGRSGKTSGRKTRG